jgi:group I intron endonuclease
MAVYSVYSITNIINGRCYVGMTTHLKNRWLHHKANKKNTTPLNTDIVSIGESNFDFKHIMDCFTKEDALFFEAFFIKELNAKYPQGYNLTDGGLGSEGRINYNKTTRNRKNPPGYRSQKGVLNVCYGKFGKAHPAVKNIYLATNLTTGEKFNLVGNKQILERGFNPSAVYTVAKKTGKTKQHHNHSFELVTE